MSMTASRLLRVSREQTTATDEQHPRLSRGVEVQAKGDRLSFGCSYTVFTRDDRALWQTFKPIRYGEIEKRQHRDILSITNWYRQLCDSRS